MMSRKPKAKSVTGAAYPSKGSFSVLASNSVIASQQQSPVKRTRVLKNQLGQLIDKIGRTEKKSSLLDDLHLDTVEEARQRKYLEQ